MDLLERKLSVLRQQKQLLQQEIADNKELGLKVGCCQHILYSAGSFFGYRFHQKLETISPIGVSVTVPFLSVMFLRCDQMAGDINTISFASVSYTHLTLPTISSV